MSFVIDKSVPIPNSTGYKYPFGSMKVGDSFEVPNGMQISVRTSAHSYGARKHMKFMVRKHEESYRCWRIK